MRPCEICLEESCNGKHDCHCRSCNLISECFRFLHPTIRITNRCTQSCSHCCFESSPKSNIMMSTKVATEIASFLKNNEIRSINLMGGEFFCNPNWFEILDVLISTVPSARLVTNGDWACNKEVKLKLTTLIDKYRDSLRFGISKDGWHTNKSVEAASDFLSEAKANFRITEPNEATYSSIVPVGRSEYSQSIYSTIGCYCGNPTSKYSFLIDEEGNIYKCPFGVWKYDNIKDYTKGGFAQRFKEFNRKFYGVFIPSCRACFRVASFKKDTCVNCN